MPSTRGGLFVFTPHWLLIKNVIFINMTDQNISDRSRVAALLFASFLGLAGAHRFYVGKTGTAIAQLLLRFTRYYLPDWFDRGGWWCSS